MRALLGGQLGHKSPLFWAGGAALYATWILLFLPTLRYAPLALDDHSQLVALAGEPIWAIWQPDHFGHVRPLKTLAFWALARDQLAVATLRALILVLTLLSMVQVQRWATRVSGSAWVGLSTAALWGLHPLTASAIAWLSAANAVPCLVGVLAFLEAGARSAQAAAAGRTSPGACAMGLAGLTLALFGHELALGAPLVLLAAERLGVLGGRPRTLYVGSALLAVAYGVLRMCLGGGLPDYRARAIPPAELSFSAARYLLENLSSILFPLSRFGVLHGDRPADHVLASLLAWVVLIAACALGWRYARRVPVLTLGLSFALAFLVPVSNFVPLGNTPVASHYALLPAVGLALASSELGARLARRVDARRAGAGRALVGAIVGLLAVVWSLETSAVVAAFGSDERLYRTSIENHPDDVEARANLADVLLREKRYEEARAVLDEAVARAPDDPIVQQNRFELLVATEQAGAALALLDAQPRLFAPAEQATRRGELLLALARPDEARAVLEEAFAAARPSTEPETRFRAGYQLVIALLASGRGDDAERLVARLLADYPGREQLLIAAQLLREEREQGKQ